VLIFGVNGDPGDGNRAGYQKSDSSAIAFLKRTVPLLRMQEDLVIRERKYSLVMTQAQNSIPADNLRN